jgi:hypothetical protein
MLLFRGVSHGALACFFPWDIGLPRAVGTGRLTTPIRTQAISVREAIAQF